MRSYIITGNEVAVSDKRPRASKGQLIVTTAEELTAARIASPRLMAIWNSLPEVKRIRKITDRPAMLERLWAALAALPAPAAATPAADVGTAPTAASKQGQVIALLRRPEGATLEEMTSLTGWQRHSVRGVLAGALKKKLGLNISAVKGERGRVYRIA